ncbi:MAG: hypothetical protein AAF394_05575 [Planctomycetota bacterium]
MTVAPLLIKVTERNRPRKLRSVISKGSKHANQVIGRYHHNFFTPQRFTKAHAEKVGYTKRKPGYLAKKKAIFKHVNPLEFSGRAKRASKVERITATSKKVQIRYPGLRVLNFRNPKSQVNMRAEFEYVLQHEVERVAAEHNFALDGFIKASGGDVSTTLVK